MDSMEAFRTALERTKSTTGRVRANTARALDTLAPLAAPVAARWDAEADRRRQLRTPEHLRALMDAQRAHNEDRTRRAQTRVQLRQARATTRTPFAAARRAARTADRAASQHETASKKRLDAARRNYPATLATLAARIHAAHASAAGIASWLLTEGHHALTLWPAEASAGVIAAQVGAVWLGRRTAAPAVPDGLSEEERQLMSRLAPEFWAQHAEVRGLDGTITGRPEMTPAGITCDVRLDGRWTVKALADRADSIRALLGARTALPLHITAGSRGGWASLRLRTRSAADGTDLAWTPGAAWGVDTITGEDVRVPLGDRLLIAGMSGAGKSVASRPLLFEASESPTTALVVIDLKRVEGRLWDHRARVASEPVDVIDLVDDLVAEMHDRLREMPKGVATWTPTEAHPRITVVVDEGAEVVTTCSGVVVVTGVTESGREITEKRSALEGLETLARMGRAACVDLWWMTQKPTMSGASAGIPAQIASQVSRRISLAVSTATEARTVLGEDAQAKGWAAEDLPVPGYALVRAGARSLPHPVRVRYMTDSQVIALPSRPIWAREAADADLPAGRPSLRLVKGGPDYELAPPAASAPEQAAPAGELTNRDRVLAAVRDGARTNRDVVDRTGLNKGTVSREVKALLAVGALRKGDDGMLTAGEVSA